MVDYRRMGNIGVHLGNAAPTTSSHHLRDMWDSPRWTVIRIQSLAVVAIIISFFLAAFGSCRRWSNSWIVQKGFFAAHVLSLSLGTYSIGLMQSSPVKSEMYPIWTVSLFTLFGCIDPVTAYNGLDYKGPLSKVVYGICLNCGYVLLMSISTVSSVVGNTAIGMLAAITFIKGFHKSLALVQQSRMRNLVQKLESFTATCPRAHNVGIYCDSNVRISGHSDDVCHLRHNLCGNFIVDIPTDAWTMDSVPLFKVKEVFMDVHQHELWSCYDVCVAYALSHQLQRHFLGMEYPIGYPQTLNRNLDYKWFLKVIEIELAFMYEVFFTSNPFLHYYQAKTASLWALASFTGICFVVVATAMPGRMTGRRSAFGSTGCTKVVDTTVADLVITFGILVSLALLQLLHLIQCWTSNWARVAVACAYARNQKARREMPARQHILAPGVQNRMPGMAARARQLFRAANHTGPKSTSTTTCWWRRRWLRLKVFVATSTNWFDKYLWQDKIGQYSMLPDYGRLTSSIDNETSQDEGILVLDEWMTKQHSTLPMILHRSSLLYMLYWGGTRLYEMLGLGYIREVLWDLLGSDTSKRDAIRLEDDMKASITEFLGQIETNRLDRNWLHFSNNPSIIYYLPYFMDPTCDWRSSVRSTYAEFIMVWHIATWYCELVEEKETSKRAGAEAGAEQNGYHRRVANALSKYCAYLVVSAPELLPGTASDTKRTYDTCVGVSRWAMRNNRFKNGLLGAMSDSGIWTDLRATTEHLFSYGAPSTDFLQKYLERICRRAPLTEMYFEFTKGSLLFCDGVDLAKQLLGDDPPLLDTTTRRPDTWETLALVWVRLLLYAAPYGNTEVHLQRLAHGGEFITHLWALLFHLGVREWKPVQNLREIITMEDAQRVLNEDDLAVVTFLKPPFERGPATDELATASELEAGVRFYHTSSPDIAMLFHIDPATRDLALVLKEAEEFTLYDGEFRAYDIAYFVSAKKLALAKTRGGQIEVEIAKESSEDRGHGRMEVEIAKESSEDEIEEEN